MKKNTKTTGRHVRVEKFYRRTHVATYPTVEAAMAALTAATLAPGQPFYAEVWEMRNVEDGKMLGVYEIRTSKQPLRLVVE